MKGKCDEELACQDPACQTIHRCTRPRDHEGVHVQEKFGPTGSYYLPSKMVVGRRAAAPAEEDVSRV